MVKHIFLEYLKYKYFRSYNLNVWGLYGTWEILHNIIKIVLNLNFPKIQLNHFKKYVEHKNLAKFCLRNDFMNKKRP